MDIYETLRRKAKKNYREEVASAGTRLRLAIKNINLLHRMIEECPKRVRSDRQRRSPPDTPFADLQTLEAAEKVLIECGPMKIAALTVVVRERGHRATDDPRKVEHAIKSAFHYHKDRFVRDAELHWTVI